MKIDKNSRKIIAMLSSAAGMIQQFTQVVAGFVYRTIFLMVFAKEYYGINGLFTNILQMFSLTELGIGTALIYSLHKHYAAKDMDTVCGLVSFYKKIYRLVALLVMLQGLCFYPFIGSVVDVSEVPADVNLISVYFLFLLQNVVGYLFAYRRSVLQVKQMQYLESLFSSAVLLIGYIVRTAALLAWKNFEALLILGIISDLLLEWIFYQWIGKRYREFFTKTGTVSREEKREIYKNTLGLMCHKIGTIVVTSTDSIVLSKYVSLAAVGIYSNYVVLVSAVSGVVRKVFGDIQPTITNYVVSNSMEDNKKLFFRILYLNMWVTSFTTVCLYLLLNPFIGTVWMDESFLFSRAAVMLICLQYYLQNSVLTTGAFTSSCGLFSKDKIRPLIESIINLIVSVVLAKRIGIAGVFVGTCVSGLLTYYWRQPYWVLYKTIGSGLGKYWICMLLWFALTAGMCLLGEAALQVIPNTIFGFVLRMLAAGIGSNLVILLTTWWTDGFRYFWNIAMNLIKRK